MKKVGQGEGRLKFVWVDPPLGGDIIHMKRRARVPKEILWKKRDAGTLMIKL